MAMLRLLLLSSLAVDVLAQCTTGWTMYKPNQLSFCYKVFDVQDIPNRPTRGISRFDAKRSCENEHGAFLASIVNQNENNFVQALVGNPSSNMVDRRAWIGAARTQAHGPWSWVDGEQWNYTNWAHCEPNDGVDHAGGVILAQCADLAPTLPQHCPSGEMYAYMNDQEIDLQWEQFDGLWNDGADIHEMAMYVCKKRCDSGCGNAPTSYAKPIWSRNNFNLGDNQFGGDTCGEASGASRSSTVSTVAAAILAAIAARIVD